MNRNPLCARCQRRHPIGQAIAYHDTTDDLYRCGGCWKPLDGDGECNTPKCCGNPKRRWRYIATGTNANTHYNLTVVGAVKS